jgi:hypothetical protein
MYRGQEALSSFELRNSLSNFLGYSSLSSSLEKVTFDDIAFMQKSHFLYDDVESMKLFNDFMIQVYLAASEEDEMFVALYYIKNYLSDKVDKYVLVKVSCILYVLLKHEEILLI